MDRSVAQFVRALYFEMQTVEDVKPLEIWNGILERQDPFEAASLAKNLLKVTIPLVNEKCSGMPFAVHSRLARRTLAALLAWFREDPEGRLLQHFPDPPTGDDGQKALYRLVRDTAKVALEEVAAESASRGEDPAKATSAGPEWAGPATEPRPDAGLLPDGLFDFSEMRIVDNELPFIIFTEKEYRVIHGLAIVYMWIIEADEILLEALKDEGIPAHFLTEYRQFAKRVQSENPLAIRGKNMDARAFAARIHEKLRDKDYLDIFEDVHKWFETTKAGYT